MRTIQRQHQFMVFSPKCLTWTSFWESRQIHIVEHSLEPLSWTHLKCQCYDNQKKGMGGDGLEETKETWKPNVFCDPWLDPWSKTSATSIQKQISVRVHREKGGKKKINGSDNTLTVTLGEECTDVDHYSFNFSVV